MPYIAKRKIFLGAALAYAVGDIVSDDAVKRLDLKGSVTRASEERITEVRNKLMNREAPKAKKSKEVKTESPEDQSDDMETGEVETTEDNSMETLETTDTEDNSMEVPATTDND